MDYLFNLTEKKICKLSHQEQLAVKEKGRPTPELNIEYTGNSRGKTYKRKFNTDIYSKYTWIYGCSRKNSLFCFPCVLFSDDNKETNWTKVGVKDLAHLSEKIKNHENSKTHINNQIRFALFGKVDIEAQLDSAYWINIRRHNDEVTKNRYVFSKIINCIKFCGAFELALRGHDESETSTNPDIFRGLINFSAELDKSLHEHLKNSTVFKGTSKIEQKYILDCMLQVCQEEIIRQINEAPFLGVIVDEMTDVSTKFQIVIVLRYVTKTGDPVERFWNFLLPQNHSAGALSETILAVLDPIIKDDRNKLIAQSYDGANVMSEVQEIVKERYENAHFVHCYAHNLNSVMSNASSVNSQIRIFFQDLQDIPNFFHSSPQRVAALDLIARKKVPHFAPTRWYFNIHTVYEHRESIIEYMDYLVENSNYLTGKQATGVRRILEDPINVFWLTFFSKVMPHVDNLYNQLQKRNIDLKEAQNVTKAFEDSINTVRNRIDCIVEEASKNAHTSSKTKKCKQDEKIVCLQVCDVVINNSIQRFAFGNHLSAASLLNSEKFAEYLQKFPDDELNATCSAYNSLNKLRLKTELSVLYCNTDCRNLRGAVPFLKFIISNNLDNAMAETKKLVQILVTTPMTTVEAERIFSTVKRVKTFLKNSVCEDRLTALSMLSIEKQFINEIPDFNEKVIDKLAANKDGRIPLKFKTQT